MANPTRFTAGLSTFAIQHVLNTYPVVPTQYQVTKGDDFIPFRQSTDYTATTGGTGATAAAINWNGGAIKLTSGSTAPFKSYEALGFSAASLQIIPGNQTWQDCRVAIPTGSMQNPSTDSLVYVGLSDTVDPSVATNGILFRKNVGGSTGDLLLIKNGVTTTFQNIFDLAAPSGVFNDTSAIAGVLAFNNTGTSFTNVTVATAGNGYRVGPLVIPFGTAGTGAQVTAQLGGAAGSTGGGIYAPYIVASGSGYTAGTIGCDLLPWINLQFWYNGKGSLIVGINNKTVLTLGKDGVAVAVPGTTYNTVTLGNSYNFVGTTLPLGTTPVQPYTGDFYVAAPQVPLQLAFGITGSVGNNRVMYADELNIGTEVN